MSIPTSRHALVNALLARIDQAIAEAEELAAETETPSDSTRAMEALVELQRVRMYVEWKLGSRD